MLYSLCFISFKNSVAFSLLTSLLTLYVVGKSVTSFPLAFFWLSNSLGVKHLLFFVNPPILAWKTGAGHSFHLLFNIGLVKTNFGCLFLVGCYLYTYPPTIPTFIFSLRVSILNNPRALILFTSLWNVFAIINVVSILLVI